jgi:6-phospho-3-hexuloisomerase
MDFREYLTDIASEVRNALSGISDEKLQLLVHSVLDADRLFSAGSGRSGLMVKAFAMRLMHIGLKSYVVGETVTPAIGKGDLLLIGSGSGETESLAVIAQKAKKTGAQIALVTVFPLSTIGRLADPIITIQAPTYKTENTGGVSSIQPRGSLFEQSMLLMLDAVVLALMIKMKKRLDSIMIHHANLE